MKKRIFAFLLLPLLSFCLPDIQADRMMPSSYMVASGRIYAKGFPAEEAKRLGSDETLGETLIYRMGIAQGDADELIHRFNWYARKIYLTGLSGVCVVRMGTQWYGQKPTANDLGIAFYRNGALFASYSLIDLTGKGSLWRKWDEESKLKLMSSGYLVIERVVGFVSIYRKVGNDTLFASPDRGFEIVLYDGTHIVFDIRTGKRIVLSEDEFTQPDPR